jgi:hypothetical protein
MAARTSVLIMAAVAAALMAAPALADCPDRQYNCILNANVVYDQTTNTATQVSN